MLLINNKQMNKRKHLVHAEVSSIRACRTCEQPERTWSWTQSKRAWGAKVALNLTQP